MVKSEAVHIEASTEGARLLIVSAIVDGNDPGIDDRARAHRARLQRNVQLTSRKTPTAKLSASAVDRLDLRVAECVLSRFSGIICARDDLAVAHDHSTDGNYFDVDRECGCDRH